VLSEGGSDTTPALFAFGKNKQTTFCVILQVTQAYIKIFNEKKNGLTYQVTYTRYLLTLRNILLPQVIGEA